MSFLSDVGAILHRFDDRSLQAIAGLVVPTLADWCFVHVVSESGAVRLVAAANDSPAQAEAARARQVIRQTMPASSPIGRVLAGGAPELIAIDDAMLADTARDPSELEAMRAQAYRSIVVAPLEARGRVLGAVTFAMSTSGRMFAQTDLDLLVDLAQRTGAALDAAQARERTRRLQELTARLVAAVDERDVLAIVVDAGRTALGASVGYAWLVDGADVVLASPLGPGDAERLGSFTRIPLAGAFPLCESIRTAQPLMLSSREALVAAYPQATPPTEGNHAWAHLPLLAAGHAVGAVSFSFADPRAFTDDDRELLGAMSGQASIALERARLYGQVRASEENLRIALTAARAATWRTDLTTMTTQRDPSYLELLGIATEVRGATDFLAVHPEDRDGARVLFERALREGTPYEPEIRMRRGDGTYTWIRGHGRLVHDADGTPIALAGVVLDIDEAKRASLRADEERRLNDALHRLGGSFASELDLDRLLARIPYEIGAQIGARRSEWAHGTSEGDDPHVLAVRIIAASGEDFGTLRFSGTFTHEHARLVASIAAPAAAALDNARLYRSVREHKEQLEVAVERAALADRRKDEFLAMLGHELRNPLAPIATALQLADLRNVPHLQRERAVIKRQVEHMMRLVDDLLDISRITRGKVTLAKKEIDLGAVIAKAIEMASPLLERARQHLTLDVPAGVTLDADPDRLAQVFHNLLTNASKYSAPGSEIAIAATKGRQRVVVEVTDRGTGIAPELLPRMFELFVQGERTIDRSQGGLGLGLAIAKNLVELHDGTIEALSAGLGHGSTFAVTLPLAAGVSTISSEMPALAKRPSRGVRVLVVDDNADAAQLLEMFLTELGFEATVAYDGVSALELAATFQPHVAVLDIGLPAMDGYELARRLRAQLPMVPRLIAVTGYGQERDRELAKEAGFDHHLVKPIALDALVPLLSSSTSSPSS